MKQTIRFNTFETNSSSTHSMIIIPDELWDKFKNNELYYNGQYNDELKEELKNDFSTKNQIITTNWFKNIKDEYFAGWVEYEGYDEEEFDDDDLLDEFIEHIFNQEGIYSYNNINDELECDCTEYTTKSGDKIHMLCYYGFNG